MDQSPKPGRPPKKQSGIARILLQKIVRGELPPGSRLPTQRELSEQYNASSQTIQAILNDLARNGFTQSRGTLGTFVHESPPHMHRHGFISFESPPLGTRYYTILRNEALRLIDEGWNIEIVDIPSGSGQAREVQALSDRVRRHLYAGLIFNMQPDLLIDTPILDTQDVPRIILGANSKHTTSCYKVQLDSFTHLLARALARLKALKYKRTGVFVHSWGEDFVPQVLEEFRKAGLETHRSWIHTINYYTRMECYPVMELLYALPPSRRPDSFIVTDDNLTEMVTLGARDFAGPTMPGIVSHCNYPWLPAAHTPVHWLGYDTRKMLLDAIGLIESNRRHEPDAPQMLSIPLRFEGEMDDTSAIGVPSNVADATPAPA